MPEGYGRNSADRSQRPARSADLTREQAKRDPTRAARCRGCGVARAEN